MSSSHMPECKFLMEKSGLIQCGHDKWHNLEMEELNFIGIEGLRFMASM